MSEQSYEIIKTAENIWRIETDTVRSWLVAGEKRALLVDTTDIHGDLPGLIKKVTDLPVILVNTHSDPDHISSNDQFESALMHPKEQERYNQRAAAGFAKPVSIMEGDKIDLGGRVFEVLFFPGHTPGSIMLLDRDNRILISGDTISKKPVFLFGPGRDIPLFQETLLRLKEHSSEFDLILTSHGEYEVSPDQIDNEITGLKECLEGKVPAEAPPFPVPAKLYRSHGAAFLLDL